MLVLPLQGLAAALGPTCASAQRDPAPMVVEDHCHDDAGPEAPTPSSHDCKHCTACALGAAMPVPVTETTPVISNALRLPRTSLAAFSAFFPDGPERPPRASHL